MNERVPSPPPKPAAADPVADPEMVRRLGVGGTERRSFWSRGRIWLAGGVGAALSVALLSFYFFRAAPLEYMTAKAERGAIVVTVDATGTLQPREKVDVGAEISGRIDTVNVDFNDRVRKGQVLAELDTEQLRARLQQSEAQLAATRATVRQFEATLEQTRAKTTRTKELFERNTVARQDLEAAEADLLRATANLQKAEADTTLAAAQVSSDRTSLQKARILSPIDGIVLDRRVEPGQAVAATMQTPVLFTLASDLRQMELQVDIDEADIGAVHEGQGATFTVDAFPQRKFDAKLIAVYNAPKTTNGVVTYQGILLVDNAEQILRPGLTATAQILAARITDALLVPNGALRFAPDEEILREAPPLPAAKEGERLSRIWVMEGKDLRPRVLSLGPSDGTKTVILSGELAEADEVIVDVRAPGTGAGR